MSDRTDEYYMGRALKLAEAAISDVFPNPRVGAVVVSDGEIVGEGVHRCCGGDHAEIEAISRAGGRSSGATLYLNLEPCCHHGETPPCTEAIIGAGISRVVFGIIDPDERVSGAGADILRKNGIEVVSGVLAGECFELNYPFIFRKKAGRALVVQKVAMTLDGRLRTSGGGWFTSAGSREYVHYLRTYHEAVAAGIGTVLEDDPLLNRRFYDNSAGPPVRMVFDSTLRFPPDSRWFEESGRVLIFCGQDPPIERVRTLEGSGAEVIPLPHSGPGLDLRAWRRKISDGGITSVMVEGGAGISTSMLREELPDILYLFVASRISGTEIPSWYSNDSEPPWIRDGGLKLARVSSSGGDILAVYHTDRVKKHYAEYGRDD